MGVTRTHPQPTHGNVIPNQGAAMLTHEHLNVIRQGLSFAEYMDQWNAKNALPMKGLDPVARRTRFYSRYNLERQERVEALWRASEDFVRVIDESPGPADWLFITDDWCVDSAYSLPLVRWGSDRRSDITLRILLKDEHPEIMDLFLTEGKRSIPKFAGIDQDGQILFSWGPQPGAIRDIRKELMDSGAEGRIVSSTTVEWYADQGWLDVEKEMIEVLSRTGTSDG